MLSPLAMIGPVAGRKSPAGSVFGLADTYPPLPQSAYDDWADDEVSIIDMPAGNWYMTAPLELRRSNVTVNFAGCRLFVNPSDVLGGNYPLYVESVRDVSEVYLPSPTGSGPGTRTLSHATGAITAATTTLTMDPAEVVDLQPGEIILIHAGVTPSDPVEVESFIPATVLSVNVGTGVITFTAPLGKDIINYGSLAGLEAATIVGLQWKIGDWGTYPSDANFSKGYGVDHGIERFVGGMVNNVIFNDPELRLDVVPEFEDMPNGMWCISSVGVIDFTINRAKIHNPFGSGMHFWRSFNILVDGYTLTGFGLSTIWTSQTSEGTAISIWGGDGYEFLNLDISGTNIGIISTEVGPNGVMLDGIDYDVTFTDARTYSSSSTIFGFFSEGDDVPVVKNATVRAVLSGGVSHQYFTYSPVSLQGYFVFVGASLTVTFDWSNLFAIALEGTVAINGVTYGPAITDTLDYAVLHGANYRDITLPPGLYISATVELLSAGDARSISDNFGNEYWPATDPVALDGNSWHQIPSGAPALAAYVGKFVRVWLNNEGSTADASVRFQVTYLPANP